MVKNFKKQTHELTKEEKKIAKHIFVTLNLSRKLTTNKQMRDNIERVFNKKVAPDRIRKVIHFIRTDICDQHFVIATNRGYKLTYNIKEIDDYMASMNQRINSQLEIWNELARLVRRRKRKSA